MSESKPPTFRNTSLPLIILTLIAGVALVWLLRDRFSPPVALAPTPDSTVLPARAPSVTVAPVAVPPTVASTTPPQVDIALPPIPSRMPAPKPAPVAALPAGYAGHVVEQGETLTT